jgi:hypothetical protein
VKAAAGGLRRPPVFSPPPVVLDPHGLHHGKVLRVQVVLVTGHIPCGVVLDLAGRVGEGVPYAGGAAVLVPGALHLAQVGGSAGMVGRLGEKGGRVFPDTMGCDGRVY